MTSDPTSSRGRTAASACRTRPASTRRAARVADRAAGLPPHRVHRRRGAAASARWCRSSATAATRSSSPVRDLRVLAGRTRSRSSPTRRSTPATRARWRAPRARARACPSSQGRFQHVNFIVEPAPLRMRVVEVVPPEPPKLLEMAQAVLDYDEDLPPVELDFVPIDLRELAAAHPAEHYLFPCRCAGLELGAGRLPRRRPARARRLDAGRLRALAPDPRRALRRRAARARRLLPAAARRAEDGPTLLKCCLRERGIEREGARLVVPVGRGARGGPRGAARLAAVCTTRSSTGTCGRPPETRELFGDAGRTRDLARDHRRARRRAGRARADPARRPRRRSPRARASRSTSRPSGRRRGAAATRRSG